MHLLYESRYDDLREYEKRENSKKLVESFCESSKLLIAGENQSGKTTLCKRIFSKLREKNYIPIYINGTINPYQGKIDNIIAKAYEDQYEGIALDELPANRVIPILDDFHFAKNKEKHIADLQKYEHQILIVDDVFCLNFRDEQLISCYAHFKIREFSPSLRNKLIKKWSYLTDDNTTGITNYKVIDQTTELVNTALGKVIGSGIMPAFPFFILTILSTYETFEKPLDQEITSQGYCYQAEVVEY